MLKIGTMHIFSFETFSLLPVNVQKQGDHIYIYIIYHRHCSNSYEKYRYQNILHAECSEGNYTGDLKWASREYFRGNCFSEPGIRMSRNVLWFSHFTFQTIQNGNMVITTLRIK